VTDALLAGRRIYFVGIGGAGLSAYANIARAWGAEVRGWDVRETIFMDTLAGVEIEVGGEPSVPEGFEAVVSTAHVGDPNLPPMLPAEAVPTSVTVGRDGYWYVGELTGFPFTPGASRIWRIAPWARNATCDEDTSDGCKLFASGFTSITGLDAGKDGSLYVVEIVKNGVLGLFTGTDTTGALIRLKHGHRTEIAPGRLTAPADVAVGRDGTLYVTNKSVMPDGEVLSIRR
jgi:hypothetical protein